MAKNVLSWSKYLFVIGSMILIYYFVYMMGGTKYVYAHLMYIPIIVAGVFFGIKGGLFFGLVAGILLGPLMPLDTATMETQTLFNWLFRLLIFLIVGVVTGLFSQRYRKIINDLYITFLFNQETGIKNTYYLMRELNLKEYPELHTDKIFFTVRIKNFESIVNLLGRDRYIVLLQEIYHDIMGYNRFIALYLDNIAKFCGYFYRQDLDYILNSLNETLNHTYYIKNIPLYMEGTLGLAPYDPQANLLEHLRRSDYAAVLARNENVYFKWYKEESVNPTNNINMLSRFDEALKAGNLKVYYQPQISLQRNEVVGFEALLRWYDPILGFISPSKIIPLIEETQLIHLLTKWLYHQVFEALDYFNSHGISTHVSINISVNTLNQPNFIDEFLEAVKERNMASYLVIEITESSLLENTQTTIELLSKFREANIKVAIDDYGRGYSSMSYLSQFPLDIIKLDKEFASKMAIDERMFKIVKSSINLAHELGLWILAEGVETEEIAALLKNLGCDYAQGYLYEKAMPIDEAIKWYEQFQDR